jgi:hypothetical protein
VPGGWICAFNVAFDLIGVSSPNRSFRPLYRVANLLVPTAFSSLLYQRISNPFPIIGPLRGLLALAPSARLSSGSSAPFLVKRSHPADEPKHTHLAWLNELHEKVWNQQSRRPELFREVIVTAADYAALQKRLTELHPDRDKQDYDGDNSDVLSDKLTFLRSRSSAKGSLKLLQQRLRQLLQQRREKPCQQNPPSLAEPLSSQHDNPNDDDDASDEDDTAMKSLFPYLLTFMDLSPLALETKDPGPFTSPLLCRDEYECISELIRKKPKNNKGSVVVSGQPGLGEFLVSLSHRI